MFYFPLGTVNIGPCEQCPRGRSGGDFAHRANLVQQRMRLRKLLLFYKGADGADLFIRFFPVFRLVCKNVVNCLTELLRGLRTVGGNNSSVNHDAFGRVFCSCFFQFVFCAGPDGRISVFQQTRLREYRGREAYRGHNLSAHLCNAGQFQRLRVFRILRRTRPPDEHHGVHHTAGPGRFERLGQRHFRANLQAEHPLAFRQNFLALFGLHGNNVRRDDYACACIFQDLPRLGVFLVAEVLRSNHNNYPAIIERPDACCLSRL